MNAPPPTLTWRGRALPVFCVVGAAAFAVGVVVAEVAALGRGLAPSREAALVGAAVATFLLVAAVATAVTHEITLVSYHHQLAVLGVTAFVAAILGGPVLPHVEATAAGLAAFLAVGRLGCLCAGCCHGRPAARGARYGEAHARIGLPAYLVDVPLVPVAAWEAAGLLALTAVLLPPGAPAGRGLVLYLAGYAVLRFVLEVFRGDPVRRFWRGLSEAQWTAAAVVILVCAAGIRGTLPAQGFALTAAAAMAVLVPWAARRRRGALDAEEVQHLRRAAGVAAAHRLRVARTPGGLAITAGPTVLDERHGLMASYAVSSARWALAEDDARDLARALLWARHPGARAMVVPGLAGVWHVLVSGTRERPA